MNSDQAVIAAVQGKTCDQFIDILARSEDSKEIIQHIIGVAADYYAPLDIGDKWIIYTYSQFQADFYEKPNKTNLEYLKSAMDSYNGIIRPRKLDVNWMALRCLVDKNMFIRSEDDFAGISMLAPVSSFGPAWWARLLTLPEGVIHRRGDLIKSFGYALVGSDMKCIPYGISKEVYQARLLQHKSAIYFNTDLLINKHSKSFAVGKFHLSVDGPSLGVWAEEFVCNFISKNGEIEGSEKEKAQIYRARVFDEFHRLFENLLHQ